jgi:hypothetical protein
VTGQVSAEPGQTVTRRATLDAVAGIVRFTGVPKHGAVRVAGRVVLPPLTVTLAPGAYDAEVLVDGRVVSSRRVTVAAGPQDLSVAP